MHVLHLDTSREGSDEADFDDAVRRLVSIYGACEEYAQSHGRKIAFEIGLERQSGEVDDPDQFRAKLGYIFTALANNQLPTFVVVQTGTLVVGTENRGTLMHETTTAAKSVRKLAQICKEYHVALKAHNVDYLPDGAVVELLRGGADAINVAPEFGVMETRAILALLNQERLERQRDRFLRLAYDSRAWEKWSDGNATDFERAVMAGHYIFGTDEFLELRSQIAQVCRARGTSVDAVVAGALDKGLERYAKLVWPVGRVGSWTS
jgi:hypothetical protein